MKLWIAFAAMCWVLVTETFEKYHLPEGHWIDWLKAVLKIGLWMWITWFGLFRTSRLQLFWGWVLFIGGTFCLMDSILLFHLPQSDSALPLHVLNAGCMALAGWLLVFDRHLVAWRSLLRSTENKRAVLMAQK